MRIGYADPPYPECSDLYIGHPDYAGEVDSCELVRELDAEYDGWVLHTASTTLGPILATTEEHGIACRVMAWVKPFAAFKANVSVAYAWEPILVKACRKPVVTPEMLMRDWIAEPMTMQKGLTGAKPPKVCRWLFHVLGAEPGDELVDLYPGTGIVKATFDEWSTRLFAQVAPPVLTLTLPDLAVITDAGREAIT